MGLSKKQQPPLNAKAAALLAKNSMHKKHLNLLLSAIKNQATVGNNELPTTLPLGPATVEELEGLGYGVDEGRDNDDTVFIITW